MDETTWSLIGSGIAGVLGLVVIIVTALPKIFGPLGEFAADWSARKQRIKRDTTAAEVRDLRTSCDALEATLVEMREKIHEHTVWDRKVYRALLRCGIEEAEIGLPPDLF